MIKFTIITPTSQTESELYSSTALEEPHGRTGGPTFLTKSTSCSLTSSTVGGFLGVLGGVLGDVLALLPSFLGVLGYRKIKM